MARPGPAGPRGRGHNPKVPLAEAEAKTVRVVDVLVDPRSGGVESVWTYRLDGEGMEGDSFFVPLGPRTVIGYAVGVRSVTEEELGFPISSLKPVYDRIHGLSLPKELMDTIRYTAEQYLCPFSLALSAAAPPGVRERVVSAWRLVDGHSSLLLTPLQKEVVQALKDAGGVLVQKPSKKLAKPTVKALKLLRGKGLVEQRLMLQPIDSKRPRGELLQLSSNSDKIESFLKREGKRKPAQALTLMRLQTGSPAPLTAPEIKVLSGVTDMTLKAMVEAGLLERVEQGALMPHPPPKLNESQQAAAHAVCLAIADKRFETFLLHGVTGSGKTEVYLRAAAEALKQGRQVLYLVPEIALAAQAIGQLRDRFGASVALLHSELTPVERLETWMRIREGKAPIVLGARSALFAPLTDVGLIVMDEEHETSYKQESVPRYHTKNLARFLARKHGAALVLGSATPSVESFYEATDAPEGPIRLLSLPYRAASATLPTVEIVDLREGYRTGAPAVLSDPLYARLESALFHGHQAILFLNRRAYSAFLICRDCGHQFSCPRCAVSLAFSRMDRRLRCHHCGHWEMPPDSCPSCGGRRLNPFGIGTEKVEEVVKEKFPAAKVARLDRDVARKKGALEDILAGFRSGEIEILVGTQMVAKGLDFPNVTLVGVIAADISLNIPDFRSAERTFQLLSQVAGRAGRGSVPGHVVIQTFNPEHVAVTCAKDHDYDRFYKSSKLEREMALYPPFTRLVNLILTGEDFESVRVAADDLAKLLEDLPDAVMLGPTQCAIERIQGRWRRHVLLKLAPDAPIEPLGALLVHFQAKDVLLTADVDPYSLI